MTPVREAQSFRQAQPVLVGLARQNAGAAQALQHSADLLQRFG